MTKDQSLIKQVKEELTIDTFKPTERQLRWLEAALDPAVKPTAADISRATGINVKSWGEWRKSPTFIKWWNEKWNEAQRNAVWQLDKIGWDRAKKDFKYWEALQIKFGGLKKTTELQMGEGGFSAGIFVVDFKKQLRGEDVEVRTVTREDKIVEGELVPTTEATKRATAAPERTEKSGDTSDTSGEKSEVFHKAEINPLLNKDLEFPQEEKEYITKTVMEEPKKKGNRGWKPGRITEEATRYFVKENKKVLNNASRKFKNVKKPSQIFKKPSTVDKSVMLDGDRLPKLEEVF